MPSFAEALAGVERWLLPPVCLLCDSPVPPRQGDDLVCDLCRSRWEPVPAPLCARCGQPAFGELECRLCAGWPMGLDRVRSAVWLRGTARDAVHRLKYEGWWRVAESLATAMRGLEPLTGQVSLVPVPLGARRLRARGYNQSERLATALGALIRRPVRPDGLSRPRETKTQTALTPEGRQANVAGAFAGGPVAGLDCVLVDDVFTTGATLVEAASALRRAGAARVEAVTFARAEPPVTLA
ncbi:MAG: ComF family protein [Gemmatimonadales bacterium]|nr:ComF family protein [Gemmatimonadales bacterium]